ncbi:ABC exporter membrane fusion protein [Calothrix sp. NIES-3974]|uniref:ABC exporter membrane fusion protein n=1 Tax=Calothrix sp. NIES-3974 TaxID=2005462 RepID=UPI000B5FB42F|nr:ABC exporter membrane fusion protein [Calothrix sp. NIES-3974]BAZ06454.1 secretion protein HlyD [Calothrix sp. NIES-3974]
MSIENEKRILANSTFRWRMLLTFAVGIAGLAFVIYNASRFLTLVPGTSNQTPQVTPTRIAVTALGRIEPEGEVTQLSAPSSLSGVRIEQMLVTEGEEVKQGQVIAHLEGYARTRAALQQARDQVEVSQARLAQVKAGAKNADIEAQAAMIAQLNAQLRGEVAAQQAIIARLQTQLNNAKTENNRYQQLLRDGAVSVSLAESKRLEVDTLRQQIRESKATLSRSINTITNQVREGQARLASLNEVRPVDVELAEAELRSTRSALTKAKAEHELTMVKSPVNGQILKIHTKTGEVIGSEGIVDIGKTSQMYVVAEVYQTDIAKVKPGQRAIITSTAFNRQIEGVVTDIGLQVERQRILSVNPAADTDRRVIQVKIRIDDPEDSQLVARLTNLQVDVSIQI